MLAELHTHLYGCLRPDDLCWLAARNKPRWGIFEEAFGQAFGPTVRPPTFQELFSEGGGSRGLLESHYYFLDSGNFARFQSSFSLIIALSSTEPQELHEIVARVVAREPADYAEYRMLFSPLLSDSAFEERVVALAEGARLAEGEHPAKQVRIAVSLLRDPERTQGQYEIVRRLVLHNQTVRRFVTGIDFCSQEEGFPPSAQTELFARVLADNARDPGGALSILYHVGESFEDKSVESAVRWVVEAARLGAHRLGHALALGVNPELFLGTERTEGVSERLAEIGFELAHADELEAARVGVDRPALQREQDRLRKMQPDQDEHRGAQAGNGGAFVTHSYDRIRVERLRSFQDWAMGEVHRTGAVIESCPTSNLRIGGLRTLTNHPLPRFVRAGLPVVIGADDPGILDTTLPAEFEQARTMGLSHDELQSIRERAAQSRSELLAGRGK